MKLTSLSLFFLFTFLYAGSQGINFENDSWTSVQQKAKKERKGLFVDAYTDWCLPCKKMEVEVFPDSSVGNFFNSRFISIRIDMEKEGGVALAKKYDVTSFPTYLYFDEQGEYIGKLIGYKVAEDLINSTRDILAMENRPSLWRDKFEKSDKTLKDVIEYCSKLSDNNYRTLARDSALFYFQKADDNERNTFEGWEILSRYLNDYNDPLFAYLLANQNKFIALSGKDNVDRLVDFILSNPPLLRNRNLDINTELKHFEEALRRFGKIIDSQYYLAKVQYFLHLGKDDQERFTYVKNFLDMKENNFYKDPKMFYYLVYAANLYKDEDGEKFEAASRWAAKSIELNNTEYKSKFVLAQLLYKEGKYEDALSLARDAQFLKNQATESEVISKLFDAGKIPEFIEKVEAALEKGY